MLAGAPLLAAGLTAMPHSIAVADTAEDTKSGSSAHVEADTGAEASSDPVWLKFDRD
jgi:hypothetical protein